MNTTRIDVKIPGKRYFIHLGKSIIAESSLYPVDAQAGRCFVVTNETIAPLYLEQVRAALGSDIPVHILPDGERFKSMDSLNAVLDDMLRLKLGRDTTMVALGGGVVGDLAGFAAAIYQRGISLVQIPTTLLSQVDSSVGGKTAVNHPLGKNLIGAFHQPDSVITDLATLDTLPDREFKAGVAEVIKYGLLGDHHFFSWLETNMSRLLERDAPVLSEAISTSCHHKANIVAADEREKGRRALLNLGHTFGHAIEAHVQYRDWLHGEAVAVGMLMAADLSQRHGWLKPLDVERIELALGAAGLPTSVPSDLSASAMLEFMQGDKKTAAGRVRLVLFNSLGDTVLSSDYEDELLQQTLAAFCQT
ncbi:MAG: 3-dehydroquinate synthase [Oceanococcus sp.]